MNWARECAEASSCGRKSVVLRRLRPQQMGDGRLSPKTAGTGRKLELPHSASRIASPRGRIPPFRKAYIDLCKGFRAVPPQCPPHLPLARKACALRWQAPHGTAEAALSLQGPPSYVLTCEEQPVWKDQLLGSSQLLWCFSRRLGSVVLQIAWRKFRCAFRAGRHGAKRFWLYVITA